MTGIYETPKVLHILECDADGNKRIVRYYRQDVIESFVNTIEQSVAKIEGKTAAFTQWLKRYGTYFSG